MAAEAVAAAGTRGAPARPGRATGPPVAFGALVVSGRPDTRISGPPGTATAAPRCLPTASGTGPDGEAVPPTRPDAAPDHVRSRRIGHAYGAPRPARRVGDRTPDHVRSQRIRHTHDAPVFARGTVVVRRRARGVRYDVPRGRTPGAAVRDVERVPVVRYGAVELPSAGARAGRGAVRPGCRVRTGARGAAGAGAPDRRPGAEGRTALRMRAARRAATSRGRDPGATRTGRAVLGGGGGRAAGHRTGGGRKRSASGDAEAGRPGHEGRR